MISISINQYFIFELSLDFQISLFIFEYQNKMSGLIKLIITRISNEKRSLYFVPLHTNNNTTLLSVDIFQPISILLRR